MLQEPLVLETKILTFRMILSLVSHKKSVPDKSFNHLPDDLSVFSVTRLLLNLEWPMLLNVWSVRKPLETRPFLTHDTSLKSQLTFLYEYRCVMVSLVLHTINITVVWTSLCRHTHSLSVSIPGSLHLYLLSCVPGDCFLDPSGHSPVCVGNTTLVYTTGFGCRVTYKHSTGETPQKTSKSLFTSYHGREFFGCS